MDRTELMGAATQQDFISYIGREHSNIIDKLSLTKEVNSMKEEIEDFPDFLTVRSPRYDLKTRVQKTIDSGQTLVLFFDEANRCLLGSTKLKLLDGSIRTLKEIHEIYGDSPFWVYSCDNEGNFIPGKARSLGITRKQAELIEVLLDNDKKIICTPDHKFMLRSGEYKEAKDLIENDSLMACYFKNQKGRERISIKGKKYEYTHRLVAQFKEKDYNKKGLVAHHIDRDKLNNSPDNIQFLTHSEHLREHREEAVAWTKNPTEAQLKKMRENLYKNFMNNKEKREKNRLNTILDAEKGKKFRQSCKERCNTANFKQMRSRIAKEQWNSGQFNNINRQNALKKNRSTQLIKFLKKLISMGYDVNEDNYESLRKQFTGKNSLNRIAFRASRLDNLQSSTNFKNLSEAIDLAKSDMLINHKVKSIKYLATTEDVYDINVEGTHNFLVYLEDESGVFVHNCIDSITQSIIFKAISDNEIFGIQFPKDKVKIVVAGNIAGGMTSGAKAFDSALYARCVTYIQSDYTIEDAKNVINYMKEKKFSKILIDFVTKKLVNSTEHIIDWLKSIETASLLNNVPTSRTLKTLSDMLKRPQLPYGDRLHGELFCTNEMDRQSFRASLENEDYSSIINIVSTIQSKLSNWAGLKSYTFYDNENPKNHIVYTLNNDNSKTDAVHVFNTVIVPNLLSNDTKQNYRKANTDANAKFKEALIWLKRFLELDEDIVNYRRQIFQNIIGKEFTEIFLNYYNEISGLADTELTVNSLYNANNIKPFIESEIEQYRMNGLYKWSKLVKTLFNELTESYPIKNYIKLLKVCIEIDVYSSGGAVENARQEMKELLSNEGLESVILKAEYDKDNKDYLEIVELLKYTINDYKKVSGYSFKGKSIY